MCPAPWPATTSTSTCFERAGVAVVWFDYSGYPPYPQLHGAFEHDVSVVDLCSAGDDSRRFLKT